MMNIRNKWQQSSNRVLISWDELHNGRNVFVGQPLSGMSPVHDFETQEIGVLNRKLLRGISQGDWESQEENCGS